MKLQTRLFISLVGAMAMLFISLPLLPLYGESIQVGFSLLWLMFCLLVIAGNFHALLRLGRGEEVEKPRFNKEQKEAIRKLGKYKRRRLPSK